MMCCWKEHLRSKVIIRVANRWHSIQLRYHWLHHWMTYLMLLMLLFTNKKHHKELLSYFILQNSRPQKQWFFTLSARLLDKLSNRLYWLGGKSRVYSLRVIYCFSFERYNIKAFSSMMLIEFAVLITVSLNVIK